jgi:hypothetical protein
MRITIFFSLLLFCTIAFSQTITVSGKIINKETRKPVERAIVTLKQTEGNRIVAFSQTSSEGAFEIKKEFNPAQCKLEVSCLGYATQTCDIPVNSQPLFIELESKDFKLKEVIVSPQKIIQRSDTITYLVSSFSSAEDRTIGDVLKKMPGIEVAEDGKIKYQGQDLNKFYIEGSDMLGGRYGLATNNISHKDVATVDIMENHQPVKALQDIVFSGSPALNIKLKEDAKSRWAGTLKGGGGTPELWTAEFFAMRFKPKTQSLETYKGNNTGNESFDMTDFGMTDFPDIVNATRLPSYIRVSPSIANDIGSSRSTFNQTNNLTSNNLVKVGKDFDLITEITGSLDRRESENVSQTTYFLGKDQVSIEDATENASDFKKAFTGKVQLKSNQKKYYFNNNFDFNYDRSDPLIHILGTYPNEQEASTENWKVSNNFDILQRTGDSFFTFRSNNEYASKPQSLTVTKNGQSPIFENISLSSFYTDNSLNYSFKIGKIRFDAPIRLLYQYKQMENTLDTETNSLNTNKLRLDITPSFSRDMSDLHVSLSGVLFYQALLLDKRIHGFYSVNPNFSLKWTVSSLLALNAYASCSMDLPDESLFYYGNILNNYRNYTAGYIDFSTGNSARFSVNMEYKDVIKTLFANLGVAFAKKNNTKISGQDFMGDSIMNFYYPENSSTEMLSASGSFSKGFEFIRGTASLFPSYVRNWANIVRNGVSIPYSSDSYSIRGRIDTRIGDKCNIAYSFFYAYSKSFMENNRQYFSSNRFSESLKVTYSLIKSLQLNYKLDHYCNELSSNNYKNFIFSDASVSYLPGSRWELICAFKNMFDENKYSYYINNELSSFYRSYKIRPRNILLSATYRF